jgi:hypothetical protein
MFYTMRQESFDQILSNRRRVRVHGQSLTLTVIPIILRTRNADRNWYKMQRFKVCL